MARLKFLVFALLSLGLWGFHLTLVGPLALAGSKEQAEAAVAGAAAPVALALEDRRSLTQLVALKVGTGVSAWNVGPRAGSKPEAPTVDRLASVRNAAVEVTPAALREQLFIALVNDVGALSVRGGGDPLPALPEGLELGPLVEAGVGGSVRAVDGINYLLLPVPLLVSDKNEVRALGNAIVGFPLLPDQVVLDQTAKSFGLSALAIAVDGKPVLTSGDKAVVDQVLTSIKPASVGGLGSGAVRELGPLALPFLVDVQAHAFAGRQPIGGTTFEVISAASLRPALEGLVGYQLFGLGGLGALLLLSGVVLLLLRAPEEAGASMVLPPPLAAPPVRQEPTPKAPLALQEHGAPPEASPDDFDFPPSGTTGQQAAYQPPPPPSSSLPPPVSTGMSGLFDQEPMSDPFASSAPPPPPARQGPPVATSEAPAFSPADEEEGQRTVAYPAFKPPPGAAPGLAGPSMDPFAMAAAQGFDSDSPPEDNPDATRVAAVPAELIRAARAGASGNTGERPALKPNTAAMPKVASMAPAAGGGNEEERHYQDVFRDFVATREKCREPADGLTFDKFRTKLLKNREQLVAKYQCRTVRFQVYVKDGKAALKATPVKE